MTRYERVEDILRLAIDMQNSYQGFSIQDIQDEFDVSRRTAIRMKDAVQRLFPSIEEVQNPLSRIKKWRLNKSPLNKMISFTAEELAELENCKSMMKNLNYTNRCDLLSEIMAKINMINESKSVATDVEALLEVEGYAVRQHPRYRMNLSTLNVISDALKSFKYLSFIYENNKGENAKLKIQPYGIIYGEKTYLLGYNEEKEGFRYYLLHKIKDAKILDEYFKRSEEIIKDGFVEKKFEEMAESTVLARYVTPMLGKKPTEEDLNKVGLQLFHCAECEVHRECLLTGLRKLFKLGKYGEFDK